MSLTLKLSEVLRQHTAPAAAELFRAEDDGSVRCNACAHRCRILAGSSGICRMRWNDNGMLRVPHGYVAGLAADPIEKKPFYHAYPGASAMSFGMLGCNFHCDFCQNWVTSQTLRDDDAITSPVSIEPQRIVELAVEHGCRVLTSTYNEPLITAEWAVEIFKLGRPHGLAGSFVSNGNATPEALEYLRPHVDLYKIDLKAFREETYRKLGGRLETVLSTIRLARQMGFWVELVTLLVPGMNDSDEELKQMTAFIADVSPEMPWHVTAFHPDYKMTGPRRTTGELLSRAYELGRQAGLQFVYAGNLPGQVGDREHTKCPGCGAVLIEREGFCVRRNTLQDGCCPGCGRRIAGVWG